MELPLTVLLTANVSLPLLEPLPNTMYVPSFFFSFFMIPYPHSSMTLLPSELRLPLKTKKESLLLLDLGLVTHKGKFILFLFFLLVFQLSFLILIFVNPPRISERCVATIGADFNARQLFNSGISPFLFSFSSDLLFLQFSLSSKMY